MADKQWWYGVFTPEAIKAKHEYYMSLQTEAQKAWRAKRLIKEERRVRNPAYYPHAKAERNKTIWQERKDGATLQAIANKYGLTRERVRQIVATEDRRLERLAFFDALRGEANNGG